MYSVFCFNQDLLLFFHIFIQIWIIWINIKETLFLKWASDWTVFNLSFQKKKILTKLCCMDRFYIFCFTNLYVYACVCNVLYMYTCFFLFIHIFNPMTSWLYIIGLENSLTFLPYSPSVYLSPLSLYWWQHVLLLTFLNTTCTQVVIYFPMCIWLSTAV